MAEPTPGPWALIPQNGSGPIIARVVQTDSQTQPTKLRLIGQVYQRKDSLEEDMGNAYLLGAARDLLAALERLTREFVDIYEHHAGDGQAENFNAVLQARAAIAKAKGATA
jgi:hypothetical protein